MFVKRDLSKKQLNLTNKKRRQIIDQSAGQDQNTRIQKPIEKPRSLLVSGPSVDLSVQIPHIPHDLSIDSFIIFIRDSIEILLHLRFFVKSNQFSIIITHFLQLLYYHFYVTYSDIPPLIHTFIVMVPEVGVEPTCS